MELFTTDPALPLAAQAAGEGVPVTVVTAAVLAALGETTTPQGLLGVAGLPETGVGALPAAPRLVAVLDAVNDPGNAGTVLRTADAAGADAVVLTEGATDPYGGKCVRASAGSLWHLPVVTGLPVLEALDLLRARGLAVLATSGSGEVDLFDLEATGALDGPTAWVFGTEAHGLPQPVLQAADRRVRVPIRGGAESLNLAAAAAVCLYASARAVRERPAS